MFFFAKSQNYFPRFKMVVQTWHCLRLVFPVLGELGCVFILQHLHPNISGRDILEKQQNCGTCQGSSFKKQKSSENLSPIKLIYCPMILICAAKYFSILSAPLRIFLIGGLRELTYFNENDLKIFQHIYVVSLKPLKVKEVKLDFYFLNYDFKQK